MLALEDPDGLDEGLQLRPGLEKDEIHPMEKISAAALGVKGFVGEMPRRDGPLKKTGRSRAGYLELVKMRIPTVQEKVALNGKGCNPEVVRWDKSPLTAQLIPQVSVLIRSLFIRPPEPDARPVQERAQHFCIPRPSR